MHPRIVLHYLFTILIFIPGSIHCMGFAKAFNYRNITLLTKEISKLAGTMCPLTAFFFIAGTILFLSKKYVWWIAGLVTVIISQVLIFDVWKDAKFGTIAKIIILFVPIFSWLSIRFENDDKKDVRENLQRTNALQTEILTEADLQPLAQPLQLYLRMQVYSTK